MTWSRMATGIDACVAGALGTQLGLVDLPNAAAGDRHLLKLLKQLLHARTKGLPDHCPRELQGVRRRLQSRNRAACFHHRGNDRTWGLCTHHAMGDALQAPGLALASTGDDKSRQRPAKGILNFGA